MKKKRRRVLSFDKSFHGSEEITRTQPYLIVAFYFCRDGTNLFVHSIDPLHRDFRKTRCKASSVVLGATWEGSGDFPGACRPHLSW